jgi:hypothetical protein
MHGINYIAAIIAVWTILWTRRDAHSARFYCGSTHTSTKHTMSSLQFASTIWLRAVVDSQHQTAQHRLPVQRQEPAIAHHTICRTRDCIPQVETTPRPYGILPKKQYSCLHRAEIHLTEATPEPLQDLTQSPVQRITSTEDTELQYITHISDFNEI